MAVPDFQTLMRPLLVSPEGGDDRTITSIRADLAERFSLSQADLDELIPSGRVTTFQNRVGWAATYLYRTKLIERPKRAVYRITDRGRRVLEENPERVNLKVLGQFEELSEFRQAKSASTGGGEVEPIPAEDEQTPEERIHRAYRELSSALAVELLDRVSEQSPEFFEQLVLDVLHTMGYGGRRDDAAERLGQSGDEGVDGVIREDRLGLDLIYVQAKRWKNVVGRPEIQKFFGALHGQRATKGVFITTSNFSREATEYADRVTPRVILVDGKELAQLMIEHGVGVTVSRQYALKRVDLHSIFEHAIDRGWASHNPVRRASRPKRRRAGDANPDIQFLTVPELEAVIRAIPDEVVVRAPAPTRRGRGQRAARPARRPRARHPRRGPHRRDDGAAPVRAARPALARRRLDRPAHPRPQRMGPRRALRRGKSDLSTRRSVPMADRLARELDRWSTRTLYGADDDPVFAHPESGRPLDRTKLTKKFKAACVEAGVRPTRFHDLRHTFATRLAASGQPMRTIQEFLGHADSKTTQIYAHYAPSAHEVEMVNAAFAEEAAERTATPDAAKRSVES